MARKKTGKNKNTINEQLLDILSQVLGPGTVDPNGGDIPLSAYLSAYLVRDLGADSLDFIEILHLVETRFNVELKIDTERKPGKKKQLLEELTVGDLADWITRTKGEIV